MDDSATGAAAQRFTFRLARRIAEVDAAQWDRCAGNSNPFVSHAFLSALEDSGSVCPERGFQPFHLLAVNADGTVIGAVPLYRRMDSYASAGPDRGLERIFDKNGRPYYPKLQAEVPYMPASGPRFLVEACEQPERVRRALAHSLTKVLDRAGDSSLHVSFVAPDDTAALDEAGYRPSFQLEYVWRNQGYKNFDEFALALNRHRRGRIRAERKKARELGLTFLRLRGDDIKAHHWDAFYTFHQNTNRRKETTTYLTSEFFRRLGDGLGDRVLLTMATDGPRPVAATLNLIGRDTLFSRYWGADREIPFLHFEVTYHQAIEYAIEHGFNRINAFPVGAHKLARGYLPERTITYHWIRDSELRAPIATVLKEIRSQIRAAQAHELARTPYRKPAAVTHDHGAGPQTG